MQQAYTTFEQVGQRRTGPHTGGVPQKWVLDEHSRRLLMAKYDGSSAVIDELEQQLNKPRWIIKKWASQLGLARQKEPFWTEEDEAYLERNLHRKSIADIAKHLGRTKTAVKLKAKRLGVNKTLQEGYTMRGLCLGLGCDHHKVEKWLERGWIKGRRRKTERAEVQGDVWLFTDKNIRDFVISHPNEIDHRRIDWLWMVDLLAGGDYYGLGTLAAENGKKEDEDIA